MQQNIKYTRLIEIKYHILQQAEKRLNRKEFCKFHGISKSKLSRILNGKCDVDLELLDYMCIELEIDLRIYL